MREGIESVKSHLWAQVRKAKANHGYDPNGDILRDAKHPASIRKVILGNVAETIIAVFGAHETPKFVSVPGFDEQQWILEIRDSELKVEIHSRPYWGFGLFTRCFLNEIFLEGPFERRSRLVYDLVAALGYQPWNGFWRGRFAKKSGLTWQEHKSMWEAHTVSYSDELQERIEQFRMRLENTHKQLQHLNREEHADFDFPKAENGLENADDDIEIAVRALHDRNSLAVERALDRVELSLIEGNPATAPNEGTFKLENEVLSLEEAIEAEDVMVEQKVIPSENDAEFDGEIIDLTGGEDEVEADWLLDADNDDSDGVPLVDLSESGEEE